MPCRHLCCCITCSRAVQHCPICRGPIEEVINAILS
jgi:hypothetical protein